MDFSGVIRGLRAEGPSMAEFRCLRSTSAVAQDANLPLWQLTAEALALVPLN